MIPRLQPAQCMWRKLMVAALLHLGSIQVCFAITAEHRTLYVSPSATGTRDGTSWDNAGSLDMLSLFISRVGAGGTILLRADAGPYRTERQISIRSGGSPNAPVTIAGANISGTPARALIEGNRSEPWTVGSNPGSEAFRLESGANYLRFESLTFQNQGNGCFRVSSDVQGLELQDIDARNVRRFFENGPGTADKIASVTGLTIRRVTVRGYSKGAIRLSGNSSDIIIEDVMGDSERQDGDDFAIGVALQGSVKNVLLRRVTMMNSQDTTHGYWNGDGFATERHVSGVRFEDTVAAGSTDGGYDIKSSETILMRTRAEDNMRNYRIWGNVKVVDCISRDPNKRGGNGKQNHFWVAKDARVEISGCRIEGGDARTIAFQIESKGEVIVRDSEISIGPDARMSLIETGGSLDSRGIQ
ncbi:hypothetical protein [Microvirga calopogonii]|uniref:hypothetical protein n=1 Tax=Microvirga calopogonii TaxID=2078013 RepID=UPI0013B36D1E|nr:hypothetical protein [Microvirga calopogonii]